MNPRCRRVPCRTLGPAGAVLAALLLSVPACSPEVEISTGKPTQANATPPTPQMPSGWKVVEDDSFTGADLSSMAQKIGAKLTGLRNTKFDVGGKRVQVNTIVALDATSAEAVMTYLGDLKPIEFAFRKGLYIYEFVCTNDAIPHAREGRKHLEGG